MRILVIDDEEAVRSLIREFLEPEEYEVIEAANGVEGVQKTFSDAPDLVLTDIRMPDMDGIAYLERVRSQLPASRLPVIVVSAFGTEEHIVRAFHAGATDYIFKPFRNVELQARVRMALKKTIPSPMLDGLAALENPQAPAEVLRRELLDVGKYRILSEIASGGQGTVYLARHQAFGTEVTVKILDPVLARNPDHVFRFLREVRIAAQMDHPHIVRVFDLGLAGRGYFYAMERLPWRSLQEEVLEGGPKTEREVVETGIRLASALGYMHAKGFLHRDVKPANILRAEDGRVKLIDFGLACSMEEDRITLKGTFLGTPGYVAPESIRGKWDLDPRLDVYGLGATLFFAAAGRQAFDPETKGRLKFLMQALEPPPDPREFNPCISEALATTIAKMMAREKDDRFGAMEEVSAALSACKDIGLKR